MRAGSIPAGGTLQIIIELDENEIVVWSGAKYYDANNTSPKIQKSLAYLEKDLKDLLEQIKET